ncbi:single-strand binding protein [Kandleria vitulina]|jgi:single-strand DNA-binding protein|uniref:Single-stranded DNA-binding protein n=1 Tax=Kandleria vitulina TaxID=1630 RepID=A0A1H2SHI7_9FIRM|nr:single-stranded DNA-binding protein [Kandleria vitulina]MEE0988187.1 single-stranded DNA-binding protein [Kandleria vitulina]SDW31061.1 single-strand binding protein [Kandleria vitulina]HAH74804.1 single-stranded DNA-binding protein [Kandleria vitulina]HBG67525.1 single-stranded DNA-binding protein [Kandleria vitulina]
MMNRVVIVGRMTRDPELRRTGNGTAVTSFTLALNRNYNSADGQQADFIPVVVWNKAAENVAQYCSKGSLVGVDGRLRSRSYDNAQGQRVFVVEVQADSVQFLETKASRERYQQNHENAVPQNNFYGGNQNSQSPKTQNQNNDFYDMKTVDLESDFNDSVNTFNIMEDDIQF